MNRIKSARKRKKISQKELADQLSITQQAVSYYENGTRTPDKDTLETIAYLLQVPPEYLTGETNDPDGWGLWEDATGFKVDTIKKEIARMKDARHVIGDSDNLQNLIGQAVNNLDGRGNTDRGIINHIAYEVINLHSCLKDRYEDQQKLENLLGEGNTRIRPATLKNEDIIYDDLNVIAYEKAMAVLIQARRDLQQIPNDLSLK
ncbi:transcriptional regulator with XRE-family HTH domain [Enterococcus sp. PF1-24]|uniref:helix-turn-helix domain-containing protein n=1 Tax=unclassified Enterococcus TaxID=2608891 RepID=UPI0024746975|nr:MULTISPECIES: helix-turn-helix transcriptional regulator [unclassified Enterococcus]MDH6363282.1 transcriptional regulator with XRE-family HTH domain [Enterococcus sp. PFB1-1]MDH6400417.1 transcriptional regulator with XRE-family HTH domain [Enterococcus sp. PF1-24]